MENPKIIGNFGEKIGSEYLRKKGYKILERNFKKKWGEIDIIGKKNGNLIFFEIKTLHQARGKPFSPEDEINFKKKNQLRKMAQIYLSEKRISKNAPYQIDILSIVLNPAFKTAKISHFENAIEDRC